MFGKKKAASGGDDDSAPSSKPAKASKPDKASKPAKASKTKSKSKSAKQGNSVNFFAAHGEKLVLGIVMLTLAYLVYEGVGGKGYDSKRQPQQLGETADKLLQNIRNGNPWPELEKERTIAHDFAKRTEEARLPSDPSLYPVPVMEVQDKGAYEKRGDPELAAPIRVIGQSVVGLIAVEAPDDAVDPFEKFEDAEKLVGKKKTTSRSSRAPAGSGSSSSMGSDAASSMTSPDMAMGAGTQKRVFPSQYNKGFSVGSLGGYGGGMGDMMSGGMSGSMSGSAPSMMSGVGGTGGSLTGGPAIKQKKTLAKPIFFNAVTALVTHDALLKEYEAKLRESASYMPYRDMPLYLSFEVQRVQVTEVDQKIDEKDWQTVTDASKQLLMMQSWLPKFPQRIPDVIDPGAFDPALTMPIPPILIQDYRRFAKHPDIDWIWDAGMAQMQMPIPDPTQNLPDPSSGLLPGELPTAGGMNMGMSGGMDSASMGGSTSGSMMGGMDMSMGGGMMGDTGMGYDTSMGYGGGMDSTSYGMGGAMAMLPPPYKMIRFYDQLKESDIGKRFRYRVRVMMEDPNYPSDRFPAPRSSDMKDDVFARVAKLRQQEDAKAAAVQKENMNLPRNAKRKVFNRTKRFTPWSDASNPIYVRGTEDVYVGKFPKKGADDPEAVLVKLDTQRGAYVPMFSFVTEEHKEDKRVPTFRRGAVLVYQKLTTQFAHPITTIVKVWKDYNFTGMATVVDMRGNKELANYEKDDPLTDIGEVMVLMGDGRVEVTNEYDDAFWYRGFTFADEREATDTSTAAPTDYGGGMMTGS